MSESIKETVAFPLPSNTTKDTPAVLVDPHWSLACFSEAFPELLKADAGHPIVLDWFCKKAIKEGWDNVMIIGKQILLTNSAPAESDSGGRDVDEPKDNSETIKAPTAEISKVTIIGADVDQSNSETIVAPESEPNKETIKPASKAPDVKTGPSNTSGMASLYDHLDDYGSFSKASASDFPSRFSNSR